MRPTCRCRILCLPCHVQGPQGLLRHRRAQGPLRHRRAPRAPRRQSRLQRHKVGPEPRGEAARGGARDARKMCVLDRSPWTYHTCVARIESRGIESLCHHGTLPVRTRHHQSRARHHQSRALQPIGWPSKMKMGGNECPSMVTVRGAHIGPIPGPLARPRRTPLPWAVSAGKTLRRTSSMKICQTSCPNCSSVCTYASKASSPLKTSTSTARLLPHRARVAESSAQLKRG